MITVEIPVGNTNIESMRIICEHFNCEVSPGTIRDYYKISTSDPINLFWLGCNIQYKLNGTNPKV